MGSKTFLVLAVFAGFIALSSAQNRRGCNETAFTTCAQLYLATDLGISLNSLFTNWTQFEDLVGDRYSMKSGGGQPSINDISRVCNAFSNFYNCLTDAGEAQVEKCMGILGWMERKFDPESAFQFDGIFAQMLFVCGPGFHMAEDPAILDCTQNTWKNYRDKLDKAILSYVGNTNNHNQGACNYSKILQTQWQETFQLNKCKQSNRESAGKFFGCASMYAYTTTQFSHCSQQNTCEFAVTYTQKQEYSRFTEDGEFQLRIVDTWKRNEKGELYLEPEHWV